MREKNSQLPRKEASATAAVKASGQSEKSFLKLALPPAEIADGGEVRMGCSVISGQFPTFRQR